MTGRLNALILSIVMAVSLVLSGQAVAASKGASPATGHMVLCTGAGLIVIFTDAEGNQTAPPHICSDCLTASLTAIWHAESIAHPGADILTTDLSLRAQRVPRRTSLTQALARAPPHSL